MHELAYQGWGEEEGTQISHILIDATRDIDGTIWSRDKDEKHRLLDLDGTWVWN